MIPKNKHPTPTTENVRGSSIEIAHNNSKTWQIERLIADHTLSNGAGAGCLGWRSTQLYKKHDVSVSTNHDNNRVRTLNLLRIRGTRIMRVYLLGRCALVEADESMEEVVAGGVVIGAPLVVGEIVSEGRAGELLGEEIDFVQEQDLRDTRQYGYEGSK